VDSYITASPVGSISAYRNIHTMRALLVQSQAFSSRNYLVPDPPGLFDGHVWPMYLKHMKTRGVTARGSTKAEKYEFGVRKSWA